MSLLRGNTPDDKFIGGIILHVLGAHLNGIYFGVFSQKKSPAMRGIVYSRGRKFKVSSKSWSWANAEEETKKKQGV